MSARYRVTNWPHYNQALIERGSLDLWIAPQAIEHWRSSPSGRRGAPQQYTTIAIATLLTLRQYFRLPLRATQGFARSIFRLTNLHLPVPDYTTLSRRAGTIQVLLARKPKKKTTIIVDSSGVNVFAAGQWRTAKRGVKQTKGWKKIHIAIDEKGEIRAVDVTDNSRDDGAAAVNLLPQEQAIIETFIADGAYDKRKVYEATRQVPAVLIPPRIDAKLWSTKERFHRRDEAIIFIRHKGKPAWKRAVRYYRRSLVEATMFRWKTIIGEKLHSREEGRQRTEIIISANILNHFTALGMPKTVPIM